MVKKYLMTLCVFMLLCIFGCKKDNLQETIVVTAQIQSESTQTLPEEMTTRKGLVKENTAIREEDRGNGQIKEILGEGDAKRLGVEKTLIWVIPDTADIVPRPEAVNRLNELLVNEYKLDFVVEFHLCDLDVALGRNGYNYNNMLLDMRELGQQADIIHSGNNDEYRDLVRTGIYEPLTEYFNTAEGQKLYNAYPERIWKKTYINGDSYGYASLIYPGIRAAAIYNTEAAGKYGIEISDDEWSFYDIEKYMTGIDLGKCNMMPVYCESRALLMLEGYRTDELIGGSILFKEDAVNGWAAVDITEEEELKKLWKTIKKYKANGWYVSYETEKKAVVRAGALEYIFAFQAFNTTDLIGDKISRSGDFTVHDVQVGDIEYGFNNLMLNMVVGVCSWSEYKEEALKFITIMQTSKEISNLLCYGIEGVHYLYQNGTPLGMSGKTMDLPIIFSELANINLLYSVLAEPEDKLVYSTEISECFPDSVSMTYDIDVSRYKTQLTKIQFIFDRYCTSLFSGMCDVDATVAEFKEKLEAEGYSEIINEINRQIREQR